MTNDQMTEYKKDYIDEKTMEFAYRMDREPSIKTLEKWSKEADAKLAEVKARQSSYTIRRVTAGETLRSISVGQREIAWLASRTCYAIIAPGGEVNLFTNRLTGKKFFETYLLKSAAQKQADWYNKQAS